MNNIINHLYLNPKPFYLWIYLTILIKITITIFNYNPTFPYANSILSPLGPRLLTTWAQFDGVHYLTIVEKGYVGTGLIQAFFPVYPLLIRFLSFGLINPIVVGVALSAITFLLSLYLLRQILELDFGKVISDRAISLMLIFPTSFFFFSLYSESLFLFTSIATFYFARRKKWLLASLCVGVASGTRLVGIFLIPALLIEMYMVGVKMKRKYFYTLVGCLGLLSFMMYLWYQFQDPLYFFHVQSDFGTSRQTSLVLLPQVFYRYAKMIMTVPWQSLAFYNVIFELSSALLMIYVLVKGFAKMRWSYWVYALLSFITPTLTGTFSSLPRYVLVIFPIYLFLAARLTTRQFYILVTIFAILLSINVMIFTTGRWVA